MADKTTESSWKKYYSKSKLSSYYENKELNYIVLGYSTGGSWCTMDLIDCFTEMVKLLFMAKKIQRGQWQVEVVTLLRFQLICQWEQKLSTDNVTQLKK